MYNGSLLKHDKSQIYSKMNCKRPGYKFTGKNLCRPRPGPEFFMGPTKGFGPGPNLQTGSQKKKIIK